MTAVKATQRGAFEYLPKPFDLRELLSVVGRALAQPSEPTFSPVEAKDTEERLPLIGRSPAMQEIYRVIARLTTTDLTVMVNGESGAGKELVARALHDYGRRRAGPFVAINMAAIPRELIESELFGHERGAFTGATNRHVGRFEQANGGTLFLDEIGDMPITLQSVLLRLLDDWTIRPVGSGTSRKVDVLLVAATHVDLAERVAQGAFRADLYYRLDTIEAILPPLRARTDFAEIARHILASLHQSTQIEEAALAHLARHAWPGNIRELRNLLTRLTLIDHPDRIDYAAIVGAVGPASSGAVNLRAQTVARIAAVHRELGGNLSATARRLGVSRNTVYRALSPRAE
jgi:two-component system nitrogen regulation response regulator GlnG